MPIATGKRPGRQRGVGPIATRSAPRAPGGVRRTPDKVLATSAAYKLANPHVAWEAYYRLGCREFGITPVMEPFTYDDVIGRYGDGCFYCPDGAFEALDHHHALAAGGPHTLDNVRPACAACNRRKQTDMDRTLINVYRTTAAAIRAYLDEAVAS